MAIRVAALVAGFLLAGVAAAAPGRFYDGLREADLCILHTTPEDCAAHADKCVTCHASVGGVDVCMETAVARKLPTSELKGWRRELPGATQTHPRHQIFWSLPAHSTTPCLLPPPRPSQSSSPATSLLTRSPPLSPTQTARAMPMRCGVQAGLRMRRSRALLVAASLLACSGIVRATPPGRREADPQRCRRRAKPPPSACGACRRRCHRRATQRPRPSGCPPLSSSASCPAWWRSTNPLLHAGQLFCGRC